MLGANVLHQEQERIVLDMAESVTQVSAERKRVSAEDE